MENILDDLFRGNIVPTEQQKFNKELTGLLTSGEKKLTELLNDRGKEILEAFIDNQAEVNEETALENFKIGFKLGMRLVIEAVS